MTSYYSTKSELNKSIHRLAMAIGSWLLLRIQDRGHGVGGGGNHARLRFLPQPLRCPKQKRGMGVEGEGVGKGEGHGEMGGTLRSRLRGCLLLYRHATTPNTQVLY